MTGKQVAKLMSKGALLCLEYGKRGEPSLRRQPFPRPAISNMELCCWCSEGGRRAITSRFSVTGA